MSLFTAIGRFFQRPLYTSDIMTMVAEMRTQDSSLEARQRAGRALLWDKNISAEVWDDLRAGRVEQNPYVYQTNHS